jgi:hypothetical protein
MMIMAYVGQLVGSQKSAGEEAQYLSPLTRESIKPEHDPILLFL